MEVLIRDCRSSNGCFVFPPRYTSPDFLYIRSWLPCIFFSGGVTVGNIGRQLAMGVPEKPHSDWVWAHDSGRKQNVETLVLGVVKMIFFSMFHSDWADDKWLLKMRSRSLNSKWRQGLLIWSLTLLTHPHTCLHWNVLSQAECESWVRGPVSRVLDSTHHSKQNAIFQSLESKWITN